MQNNYSIMKKIIFLVSICIGNLCMAQTDTIYYNDKQMKCKKEEATSYRAISKQAQGYLVKEISMQTQLPEMIAMCSEVNPFKKNGKCTYYNDKGRKESEGNFLDNSKDGIWVIWDEDGKDSSVIECFAADNTYKNIRISKNQPTLNDQYNVIYKLEQMPEFPGGEAALIDHIIANVVYPKSAKEAGYSGTCYVKFVVEKDGSISNVGVIRGVPGAPECDEEAMRVIKIMPNWKPGLQNGKPVRVYFNIPIKFTLYSNKKNKKRKRDKEKEKEKE